MACFICFSMLWRIMYIIGGPASLAESSFLSMGLKTEVLCLYMFDLHFDFLASDASAGLRTWSSASWTP
jgi:hypothetical protein